MSQHAGRLDEDAAGCLIFCAFCGKANKHIARIKSSKGGDFQCSLIIRRSAVPVVPESVVTNAEHAGKAIFTRDALGQLCGVEQ